MIDTKQMKKDLQKLAKALRGDQKIYCQCCMSEKQIAKKTCTLNFYKQISTADMHEIILCDLIHEFRTKYGEIKTSIETNSLNQTMIRFSW